MSGINGPQRPSTALLRASLTTALDLNQLSYIYEPENLDDQDSQRSDSSESPEDLEDEIEEHQMDLHSTTADKQQRQDLLADAEANDTAEQNLRRDLETKLASISELESENRELLQRPTAQDLDDAVDTAMQPLRQTIHDNEQANDSLQNKVSQLENQVALLEQRPTTESVEEAIRAAKKPLADQLDAAAEEASTLRMEITELAARPTPEQLNSAIDDAKSPLEEQIGTLQMQITELTARPTPEELNSAINDARHPLEEQIRTFNGDAQRMRTRITELEGRPSREDVDAALAAIPENVQAQLEAQARRVEELQQRPTQQEFDDQINSLRNSLDIAKKTYNSLHSLTEATESTHKASVSKEMLRLQKQNQDLAENVKEWKLRVERLTTGSATTKAHLESDIKDLEDNIAELQRDNLAETERVFQAQNTAFNTLEEEKKKAREQAEAREREHRTALSNAKSAAEEKELELRRQLGDVIFSKTRLNQRLLRQTELTETATTKSKKVEKAYSKLSEFKKSILAQYIATGQSLVLEQRSLKGCVAVLKSVTRSLYHASQQKQSLLRIFLRLRDEHASLKNTHDNLFRDLEEAKRQQNQQESAASAQATALRTAISKQEEYKTGAEKVKKERGRVQASLDKAQAEVARLTTKEKDLRKGLEDTLKKRKIQDDKDAESRKKDAESREEECRKHTSELATLRLSCSTLEQEKATLTADGLNLQKKITEANTKATTAQEKAKLLETKVTDTETSVQTLTAAATKNQKTIRYLRTYENYSLVVEEARLKLLEFLYTRLGYIPPDNSRPAFEEDHGKEGGLAACTDARIKQCGLVFDMREQIESNALTNLKECLQLIPLLTARVQSLYEEVGKAPQCNCDEHITALTARNTELEQDVSRLVDDLRTALDRHETITTDQSNELDALSRDMIKMEEAYDHVVEYVEGKIRDGKIQ